ncbi:MAG: hypothetical protein IJW16_07155 [Clostridia bacterium]|nr:hypothetical protein [Clostridia bacterium]
MDMNFTIPVNEAFEKSAANPACGCPLCSLYRKLEEDELDLILGASMMEPAIRIRTNKSGFCRTHYDLMFTRKNRLGMALTLESHLAELKKEIRDGGLGGGMGSKPIKRIGELESTCYICDRIGHNFDNMVDTAVYLWETDPRFSIKLKSQPYFCLPHYRMLLQVGQKRLGKRRIGAFASQCAAVVEKYMETIEKDVSWFCKKFDYRYDKEPWYNSKDAVERAFKFLRSDIHNK